MYIFLQLALIFTYSHHCGSIQPSLIYYFFFLAEGRDDRTMPYSTVSPLMDFGDFLVSFLFAVTNCRGKHPVQFLTFVYTFGAAPRFHSLRFSRASSAQVRAQPAPTPGVLGLIKMSGTRYLVFGQVPCWCFVLCVFDVSA